MEDKINTGYRLFVENNIEKQELVGVYIKEANGATTKVRTRKNELDFFRILPSVREEIVDGYILEIRKKDKKYHATLTKEINKPEWTVSSDYFLNTLVDLEEKIGTEKKRVNIK